MWTPYAGASTPPVHGACGLLEWSAAASHASWPRARSWPLTASDSSLWLLPRTLRCAAGTGSHSLHALLPTQAPVCSSQCSPPLCAGWLLSPALLRAGPLRQQHDLGSSRTEDAAPAEGGRHHSTPGQPRGLGCLLHYSHRCASTALEPLQLRRLGLSLADTCLMQAGWR